MDHRCQLSQQEERGDVGERQAGGGRCGDHGMLGGCSAEAATVVRGWGKGEDERATRRMPVAWSVVLVSVGSG
jgi:hypothetical protein